MDLYICDILFHFLVEELTSVMPQNNQIGPVYCAMTAVPELNMDSITYSYFLKPHTNFPM